MRMVQMPKEMDQGLKQKLWMSNRFLQAVFFTLIFFGLATYLYFRLWSPEWLTLTIPVILISALYPIGFNYPFRSFTSLRNVPGLKLILISASWSYVTYLIPAFCFSDAAVDIKEFVFRTFLVAALVIPFDIRDKDLDMEKMKTLPQTVGENKSKYIAFACVLIYGIWKVSQYYFFQTIDLYLLVSWSMALIIASSLIPRMHTRRSELYCGFWVESVPVFAAITLFLITQLKA